ncbi:MAG TPA: YciI family protein [Candidatus Dormibacteraeota bacterium]|nr:YciI family protein [Candidatus Dormibacteraeota bacterium]
MNFETYTITLLLKRDDAPDLSEQEEDALQDAHMAHLADLHEEGHLLAAGPVLGAPDRELRGFSILNVGLEYALELEQRDPAVKAGRYRIEAYTWMMPASLMSFSHASLPRSMREARDG